jgi:hypothetical protein
VVIPILFPILLSKYDSSASDTTVVDNKNIEDENIIFLSNSVNFSFVYGLKRINRNNITKYFNPSCIRGRYDLTDLKYAKFKTVITYKAYNVYSRV